MLFHETAIIILPLHNMQAVEMAAQKQTKKTCLADFGISKFVVACTGANNTQPLHIQGGGRAAFLPPEQLSAKYTGTGCDVICLWRCLI